MNDKIAMLESFFASFPNRIDQIRRNITSQNDRVCAQVYARLNESKMYRDISEYREELLAKLNSTTAGDLKREKKLVKPSHKYIGGKMSLTSSLTTRLEQKHAFTSVEKIKYVNLLRAYEFNESKFGIDENDEARFQGYEVLSAVVLSLDRVFIYLTSQNVELSDLMVIRRVDMGLESMFSIMKLIKKDF